MIKEVIKLHIYYPLSCWYIITWFYEPEEKLPIQICTELQNVNVSYDSKCHLEQVQCLHRFKKKFFLKPFSRGASPVPKWLPNIISIIQIQFLVAGSQAMGTSPGITTDKRICPRSLMTRAEELRNEIVPWFQNGILQTLLRSKVKGRRFTWQG